MSGTNHPLLQGAGVSRLIPQKPPMEMVDTLWFNDDTRSISGFHILPDCLFVENDQFTEAGLIENIAQTAALRTGYMAAQQSASGEENKKPPVGYIGAIKKLKIHQLPKVGDTLRTEIVIQQMIFDVALIHGQSTVNGQIMASCEMKIFLKKED